MEVRRYIKIGVKAGLVVGVLAATRPFMLQDPLTTRINNAGQRIADSLNNPDNDPAAPVRPTARMVEQLRAASDKLRGTETQTGGFRMAIAEAGAVILERPKIGPEIYSCINEVAAATRIPLAILRGLSDEQGAYALQMIVDAGVTVAHRNGVTPTACPYIRDNP